VTLFALAWIAEGAPREQSPKLTPPTSASPAVVVALGEPVWFTNIRNERLVRCSVSITNKSDHSFWIQSRGTNEFVHNYETRRDGRAPWELQVYDATGTSPMRFVLAELS
jgi:hypothetical protein